MPSAKLFSGKGHEWGQKDAAEGLLEESEELLGSLFGVDLADDVGDTVVGIGDKGGAHGAHIFASCHFLFLPYAEGLVDFGGFIAEEGEGELVLLSELNVAGGRILADAYYCVAQ